MGIEPTLKAWEALVLPLNYTRIAHGRRMQCPYINVRNPRGLTQFT